MSKAQVLSFPKCKEHIYDADKIHLKKNAQNPRICLQCQNNYNIPQIEILSIQQFQNKNYGDFLPNYPLLTDPNLINKVKDISQAAQYTETYIKNYFNSLKTDFNIFIERSEKEAKEYLIKLGQQEKKTIQVFEEAQQIDNFKKILLKQQYSSTDQDLKNFIQNQWENAQENTSKISDELNQFNEFLTQFKRETLEEVSSQIKQSLQKLKSLTDNIMKNIEILIKKNESEKVMKNNYLVQQQKQQEIDRINYQQSQLLSENNSENMRKSHIQQQQSKEKDRFNYQQNQLQSENNSEKMMKSHIQKALQSKELEIDRSKFQQSQIPTENSCRKFIQNFLEENEFSIYDVDNNVAIDIFDTNRKILQAYHLNFNHMQLFNFKVAQKYEDSVSGYFESKSCPGIYLSIKENLLCLSYDKESSLSFIQFSQDGFAQISFNAKAWHQLIVEQTYQSSQGKKQPTLKLVQSTNPTFFNWIFLVR